MRIPHKLGKMWRRIRGYGKRDSLKTNNIHLREPRLSLKEICGGDKEIYEAMQYFLLLEPKRQIPLLGDIETLVSNGERAKEQGNNERARIDFETAARISIWSEDEDNLKRCLALAEQVSSLEKQHRMHETILRNPTRALEIAGTFYEKKRLKVEISQVSVSESVAPPISVKNK